MKRFIIIIGAGRSGTNILGHILASTDACANTFENRYIWNYRQSWRDEFFPEASATEARVRFIRQHFERLRQDSGKRYLIDKTPGNGLRLGYVRRVLSDAIVINIVRDGRFNLSSRIEMWARQSLPTRVRNNLRQVQRMMKSGNLPPSRLSAFFADNLTMSVSRLALRRPIVRGERLPGIVRIAQIRGMRYARAVQWRDLVAASIVDGPRHFGDDYYEIRYEDLVAEPEATIGTLLTALELEPTEATRAHIAEIRAHRIRDEHGLSDDELKDVEAVLKPLNQALGYEY